MDVSFFGSVLFFLNSVVERTSGRRLTGLTGSRHARQQKQNKFPTTRQREYVLFWS